MKKGVKSISGKSEIKVNEWQTYTVKEWYESTPMDKRNSGQLKWAVYFINKGKPEKILEKTEGTFRFQQPAVGNTYLIVAYLYEPELSTGLKVTVVPSAKKEITSLKISSTSKKIAYGSTLDVIVQTTGMEGDYLELTLYEDDADGKGHNSVNDKNLLKTKKVQVGSQGVAKTNFLLEPDFQKIANAYNKEEGSQHEFYVAAYYLGSLKATSDNINVANPAHVDTRKEETTNQIKGNKPVTPPPTPPYKGKPDTVKPVNGNGISKVTLVKNGPKKLSSTIYSKGLIGKNIRFKVMEHDTFSSHDLLVNQVFTITNDVFKVNIALDKIPQSLGGGFADEGNEQELFVDVEVIETKTHILSEVVNVDISEFKVEIADNKTETVIKDNPAPAKPPKGCICKDQYEQLIWGGSVNCDFRQKVVQICKELWGESRKMDMANGLMAVMKVETDGSFKAHQIMGKPIGDVNKITKDDFWLIKKDGSKTSRAVGLIQFTQAALVQIGEFKNGTGFDKLHAVKLKFAKMGEIAQLDYVKKYFEAAKDKIKTPEDIYLQVFAPGGVGKKDNFVLYSVGTEEYRQNKSIDLENNGDGQITRAEILGRYKKSKTEGANKKTKDFTCGVTPTAKPADAKGVVTYRVYSTGKIEKHIPKTIKAGFEKKYKYVYHDKSNGEHDICTVDFVSAQNWLKGSKSNGGAGWEKKGTRYYQKGSGTNILVNIPASLNYSSGATIIKYGDNSTREYMDPRAFASFIGALAECGYKDVMMNGFTSKDGTGSPSVSHINGIAGDLRYLRKDKSGAALHINTSPSQLDIVRQEKLIDAFVKFGYASFLSFNITVNNKPFRLKLSTHLADHHHHIHLNKQGYNPKYTEIKEK